MKPDGMREVSKTEFFAKVGPMNVHPSNVSPDYTVWETWDRIVVGRSLPGWKHPGEPHRYFLS